MLKDTTITKRQLDLAMRMMVEQVSRLSDGDYEQPLMVQLRRFFQDQAVMVHEPWWMLRRSEAELADVLSSALTRESCIERCNLARGGVLKFMSVVNHDTSMHAVQHLHTAFRQTVRDTVLIQCSICSYPR